MRCVVHPVPSGVIDCRHDVSRTIRTPPANVDPDGPVVVGPCSGLSTHKRIQQAAFALPWLSHQHDLDQVAGRGSPCHVLEKVQERLRASTDQVRRRRVHAVAP
eukprot:1540075-Rhodomonas_salina.5